MSLLDTASLIVTPNGYKEGKLYSVIPSDGSGDLSVTRATTATRVNSQGLVELVPYNLLTYSNTFSNAAWNKINSTVTSGQSGYDGSTNAWKLQATATNNCEVDQSFSESETKTFSIYAKAGNVNFIAISVFGAGYGWYNLSNGTLGSSGGTFVSRNIESVGNGWYRCSIVTNVAASGVAVYVCNADNSIATSVGSNIFIQNSQLEGGSVPTTYQKTETRLNIPRLDYSNGTCPSILVEPQRTNVCRYSNNLSGADWINQTLNTTLTRIQTGGVDGNAFDRLVTTGSGGLGRYVQTSTLSGSNAVWSVYLRGTGQAAIGMFNAGQSYITNVTLTSDWTRYECKITSGTSGYMDYSIYVYGGSSVDVSSCQLEFATYATSYIPTTSASVTRNADVISKTGISSLIGQTEGTLFWDVDFQVVANNDAIFIKDNASYDTFVFMQKESSGIIACGYYGSGALQARIESSAVPTGRHKIAFAYKNNDFVMYLNGTQVGTDTSGTVSGLMDYFDLHWTESGCNNTNASALWKTRLTNAQLATLTTI